MTTPEPQQPLPPRPYGNSIFNAFTFDITQEEDREAGYRFQPQVQDGWRSYNLFSFRTDKQREFAYWIRQILAINPSIVGMMQLLSSVFYGTLPRWLLTGLYVATGLSVYTILTGAIFFLGYGIVIFYGLKMKEIVIPTVARLILGIIGAVLV